MSIHPEAPQVVVYTKPRNCVKCDATKRLLRKLEVPFVEVDITADTAARNRIVSLGYAVAPVVTVGDMHWGDHRDTKIRQLDTILRNWEPHDGETLAHKFLESETAPAAV